MAELRLSGSARADLVAIRVYGVEHFGSSADTYFRRFREVFQLLREYPQAGALQDDLGADVRCFTHRRHRNRATASQVKILRIRHHAQEVSGEMLGDGE